MKEIKTENELIAEFDGYKFVDDDKEAFPLGYWMPPKGEGEIKCIDDFEYHSSFDWLMPVVEKIAKICLETDWKSKQKIDEMLQVWNDFSYELHPPKIERIYKAVIEFINWYNLQPKQ